MRFFILFISSLLLAEEVSVFGAGDLTSSKPYGLSSEEKYILDNKKSIKYIDTKLKSIKSKINLIQERIDGLESLYEADSKALNKLKLSYNKILLDIKNSKKDIANNKKISEETYKILQDLAKSYNEHLVAYKKDLETTKKLLKELTITISNLDDKYVTKEEFSKFQDLLLKNLDKLAKKTIVKDNVSSNSNKKFNKSKKALMEDARRYFKKDYFSKAIPILEYLISKHYRPAECNYLMGEIKFYRKKYKEALAYYKKSTLLYDKAKYMPRLLLHSAIAFEKIGDIDNAVKFYSAVLSSYPKSKEAKEAQKYLK